MKIGFKNFKSFYEDHELSLGLFNVIIGKNNAGKSSLSDLIYYYLLVQKSPDKNILFNADYQKILQLTNAVKLKEMLKERSQDVKLYNYGKIYSDITNINRYNDIFNPIKLHINIDRPSNNSSKGMILDKEGLIDPKTKKKMEGVDVVTYEPAPTKFLGMNEHDFFFAGDSQAAPYYNSESSISMNYSIKKPVDYRLKEVNTDDTPNFDQYLGDTIAKNEGLAIHKDLLPCGCESKNVLYHFTPSLPGQIPDKPDVEVPDPSPSKKDKKIGYFTHKSIFENQIKRRSLLLEKLIKLNDCFDHTIYTALNELYNGSSGLYQDEGNKEGTGKKLTLQEAIDWSREHRKELFNFFSEERLEILFESLRKYSCYTKILEKGKSGCTSCHVCGFNIECVNDPINRQISEYIVRCNLLKKHFCENLKSEQQELMFHTDYTGSHFSKNSHPFLNGLQLARKDSDENNQKISEFYTSFGDDVNANSTYISSIMSTVVTNITRTVFQEKYFDIINGQRNLFSEWWLAGSENYLPDSVNDAITEKTSHDHLIKTVKYDIYHATLPFHDQYSSYLNGKDYVPALLELMFGSNPRNDITYMTMHIFPNTQILREMLLSKKVSMKDKKFIFRENIGGDVPYLPSLKKTNFNKKTKKGRDNIKMFVESAYNLWLAPHSSHSKQIRQADPTWPNVEKQAYGLIQNFSFKWKTESKAGKRYVDCLFDLIIRYNLGSTDAFSLPTGKNSSYDLYAPSLLSSRSPFTNANYERNYGLGHNKNLFDSLLPKGRYLEAIKNRFEVDEMLHSEKTEDWACYGLFFAEPGDGHFSRFKSDELIKNVADVSKRKESLEDTLKTVRKIDFHDPTILRLRSKDLDKDTVDCFSAEFNTLSGKEAFEKAASASNVNGDARLFNKSEFLPPTIGKIFYIDNVIGKDFSVEQKDIENQPNDLLFLQQDLIEKEAFVAMIKFLRETKTDSILNSLCLKKLEDYEIELDPDLGSGVIKKDRFKKLLNADKNETPYVSLSFLAIYSRMVREILKDLDFALLDKDKGEKTIPFISEKLQIKVAKKYNIKKEDVMREVQIIHLYILKKLIASFQKRVTKFLYHDYIKHLQDLSLTHHPQKKSDETTLEGYNVSIINPTVWKPYQEGLKRGENEDITFEEIKAFLGRDFASELRKDIINESKISKLENANHIVTMINYSLESIGTDIQFKIIPVFSRDTTYLQNDLDYIEQMNTSRSNIGDFSGVFRMFIKSGNQETPLNRAGEGVSALISILSRVHSPISGASFLEKENVRNINIIREPENHLHPNLISKLIEHLFDISMKPRVPEVELIKLPTVFKHFVIETHSEVILRQVQASMKKWGKKNKKDLEDLVKVYYVDKNKKDNSVIKDLKLKTSGFFGKNIPKGFFDINTKLIADLWKEDSK